MKHKKHSLHDTNDPDRAAKHSHHSNAEVSPEDATSISDSSITSSSEANIGNADYEELKRRLKTAENIAAEAEVLYKRMAADFENYRKRVDRERLEFKGFGLQQAAEAMLPALDDLDRAQAGLNNQMSSEDLLQSISLVFNRIKQSTEQIGLKPIEAMGEHFDPQFHEPVQKIETSEFPDGAVMEVLRKGYTLNDRVIRPALVNVASAKSHDHQEEPAESET